MTAAIVYKYVALTGHTWKNIHVMSWFEKIVFFKI